MTTRILPPEEWGRLAGTELETVWPHLDPARAAVLVVERDGVIVACWARLTVVHLEGLWIDPAYRKTGSVARRLLAGMRRALTGERSAVTSSLSADVTGLIEHFGGSELPGRHFVMRMS